jgi:diketogulonate reductase-like aldo/keto reductase
LKKKLLFTHLCNKREREKEALVFGNKQRAEVTFMSRSLGGENMEMELKHAGFEGPAVLIPRVGLGVYMAPPKDAYEATLAALKIGYRHIDTAALYGNEKGVGQAVRESGIPRQEVFITTKLWNSDHGYDKTLRAFNRSLAELGFDYVDLYLVHSPMAVGKRIDTWKAMEQILKSGKARAIGVSNYGVHHLKELFANCEIRPSVNQIELTPFNTRKALVKFCEDENIVLESYSPLTRGERLKHKTLVQTAQKYNKSTAQLLIRWCLQKNFVTLPKSVTPSRIAENFQVFDFSITPEDMAKLDSLDEEWVAGWDPTKAS